MALTGEEYFSASGVSLPRILARSRSIGSKVYNQVDDGAWTDLRDLHIELDEAVATAYGWPTRVAHDPDESNRRLLELNRAIAAGEAEYQPFEASADARV
jgi:hypothetical protein